MMKNLNIITINSFYCELWLKKESLISSKINKWEITLGKLKIHRHSHLRQPTAFNAPIYN